MEHIPSLMTISYNYFFKNVNNKWHRLVLISYILYVVFSPQVFAQEVEAPIEPDEATLFALVEPDTLSPVKEEQEISIEDERVRKIKAYYDRHNLPLASHAEHFVIAADTYGIDWRLVAAIGFIESTGGKHACKKASYSPFGWGSCTIDFDSYDHAIDVVSMNLGGHNPNTAYFYKDKSLAEVLYAYNSVIPSYRQKILREMEIIQNQEK